MPENNASHPQADGKALKRLLLWGVLLLLVLGPPILVLIFLGAI